MELPNTHESDSKQQWQGILSCVAYGSCSVAMVLGNKFVTNSIPPNERNLIPDLGVVWFQCLVAVVVLEVARTMRWIEEYPSLKRDVVKSWLPINIMFIGMLYTGFMAYIYLSVPMITIMKNLTNLITMFGDYLFFNQSPTWFTTFSILLMTIGAIMAGANDLEFSFEGYAWMIVNCVLTACYTLYMRYASVYINLPRLGMVYYNNVLSVLLLTPLCVLNGDVTKFLTNTHLLSTKFVCLNLLTGLFGVCLNFSSLWCVAKTSATTYAIVGSTCKIPVTILGFVLFYTPVTQKGLMFITMGTLGGLLYGYSKLPQTTSSSNPKRLTSNASTGSSSPSSPSRDVTSDFTMISRPSGFFNVPSGLSMRY